MTSVPESWNGLVQRNAAVGFLDQSARGAGQVMFQNNPITGLLFLVGIGWGSVAAGMPQVVIGAVVALVVSTAVAMVLRVDRASLRIGLFGYNGVLVGCAVPTFLSNSVVMWVFVVVGAALSVVVMMAVTNVVTTWQVPALTFPFVLTTWVLLLSVYQFAQVPIGGLSKPEFAAQSSAVADPGTWTIWAGVETLFSGVAQVFLINNAVTGVIFVIALAVCSRWAAGFAILGSAVALGVSVYLGAQRSDVEAGLFAFSAVLTAIALGCTFYAPSWRVLAYSVFGVILTMIVQGAMDSALAPVGIPTLTAPFVVATWLFLLPKQNLTPLPHKPIPGGQL